MPSWVAPSGDDAHVLGLETLRASLHLELDGLTLLQAAETLNLNGGLVAEHIFAPVILLDEAKALRVIEPLDSTLCHRPSAFHVPSDMSTARAAPAGRELEFGSGFRL
jgi:hypothetical protein